MPGASSTSPDVSVVIAVFNARATLARCLDSVLRQRGCDVEVIVIDGGSTDGSAEIVQSYAPRLAFWRSKPDAGVYDAWNTAIARARGRWISFIGADDEFADDEALSALVRQAAPTSNLVFGRVDMIDAQGRVAVTVGAPWDWDTMKREQNVAQPGALHARTLFSTFGQFDQRYSIAADYDFLLRVGREAVPAFLDRVVVRFSNQGMSNRRYRELLAQTRDIQARHPEIGPARAWARYLRRRGEIDFKDALPDRLRGKLRALRDVIRPPRAS